MSSWIPEVRNALTSDVPEVVLNLYTHWLKSTVPLRPGGP